MHREALTAKEPEPRSMRDNEHIPAFRRYVEKLQPSVGETCPNAV